MEQIHYACGQARNVTQTLVPLSKMTHHARETQLASGQIQSAKSSVLKEKALITVPWILDVSGLTVSALLIHARLIKLKPNAAAKKHACGTHKEVVVPQIPALTIKMEQNAGLNRNVNGPDKIAQPTLATVTQTKHHATQTRHALGKITNAQFPVELCLNLFVEQTTNVSGIKHQVNVVTTYA